MEFIPSQLIRKKRFGGEHTRTEIEYLVQGFARGEIPDYQMAAWLMAICFRGMSPRETAWLTQEMRDSGVVLDLSSLGPTVDKHSTGGLGDKTSLILAPLVAAAGVPVPMMAGRGLGHTGGTLDKLESIPGFDVNLDLERFRKQVATVGAAIIGQTKEFCPADRKLYALRDVTGTIDSQPLICGSIMSKKLAEGMSALVLDVKFGSGAFMKSGAEAEILAEALMQIGVASGKMMTALITRMDEPLGRFVGNALEVRECLDIMEGRACPGEGKGYEDTLELTLELAAYMIFMGGRAPDLEESRLLARHLLRDGSARRKFGEICAAQGGLLDQPLPKAAQITPVHAEQTGYLHYTDLEKLGLAGIHLGAGRKFQTDPLDHAAGIEVLCAQGQKVARGQSLFQLHHASTCDPKEALHELKSAFAVSRQPVERSPLIAKVLT
ncbi:MAG: thymidine phosphorylase [Bdellovibrionales bacterium]